MPRYFCTMPSKQDESVENYNQDQKEVQSLAEIWETWPGTSLTSDMWLQWDTLYPFKMNSNPRWEKSLMKFPLTIEIQNTDKDVFKQLNVSNRIGEQSRQASIRKKRKRKRSMIEAKDRRRNSCPLSAQGLTAIFNQFGPVSCPRISSTPKGLNI